MSVRALLRPDATISGPATPFVRRRQARPARPKDILIVLHQEHSTPGRVGRLLQERGFRLDVRRPRFGDPLPVDTAPYAGAVIFGGPMSANDPDDFVKAETDWIGLALKDELPFLGICLGAQMLARHLGAKVGFHPEGHVEVGYYPLYPSEAACKELPWPDHVYQWHRRASRCRRGPNCSPRATPSPTRRSASAAAPTASSSTPR